MKYKSILPFIGEYAVISIEGDKYGVINLSAQLVMPSIFREYPYDWLAVENDGKCYYINQKGERVLL